MKKVLPYLILVLFFASCSKKGRISTSPTEKDKKHAKLIEDTLNKSQNLVLDIDSNMLNNTALKAVLSIEKSNKKDIYTQLKTFYTENNLKTKWLSSKGPEKIYYSFTNILDHCDKFALNPKDYDYEHLNAEILQSYAAKENKAEKLHQLDIKISALYFLFVQDLSTGRISNPGNRENIWIRDQNKDFQENINALLSAKNGSKLIKNTEDLKPDFSQYTLLQEALFQYKNLDKEYGNSLFTINNVDKIEVGQSNTEIPKIRRRLAATDKKLFPISKDSLLYDTELAEAVHRFQDRHGLLEDGVIGANTIKQMNVSFSEKIEYIKLNMERYRWQYNPDYDHYLTVNIPEYKLRIYEKGKEKLQMRVVVGKTYTSTPVFNDTLQYIVFSPTWVIPKSIIVGEMIPKLRENPHHYSNRDFVFYRKQEEFDPSTENWNNPMLNLDDYMVIQKPGTDNALGLVKFIFPNHMSIYLHDTPSDHLFNRTNRAFSHGCIRVEEPSVLAKYLLKENNGWNNKKVVESMFLESPKQVNLEKPYPVIITYFTAWVDDNGEVNFREDIYGHDKKQLALLNTY